MNEFSCAFFLSRHFVAFGTFEKTVFIFFKKTMKFQCNLFEEKKDNFLHVALVSMCRVPSAWMPNFLRVKVKQTTIRLHTITHTHGIVKKATTTMTTLIINYDATNIRF